MKLFEITQNVNTGYDTYDSAVVCAENEIEAAKIHPNGTYDYPEEEVSERFEKADSNYGTWSRKKYVKVSYIGKADPKIKKGVVVASFNAG